MVLKFKGGRTVETAPAIFDRGTVRLGGQGPVFRSLPRATEKSVGRSPDRVSQPAIADSGKVQIGGQGPMFR